MQINEFIFSDKGTHRLTRHLVFWILYGFYFWVQSIVPENVQELSNFRPYRNAFISLICFLPSCILSVYVCIYWILPTYHGTKSYIRILVTFLGLVLAGLIINYFTSLYYYNHTAFENLSQDESLDVFTQKTFINILQLAYHNLIWALSIGVIALGLKFSKNWYLQQQENLELMQKKSSNEIQFQRAQIQPEYLTNTLQIIYQHIQIDTIRAAAMILKLSELLSYSLYESEDKMVQLEKEISALKNYILLEQTKKNSHQIQLQIIGSTESKFIPPLLILSIFQDCLIMLYPRNDNLFIASISIHSKSNQLNILLSFQDFDKTLPIRNYLNDLLLKTKLKLQLSLLPGNYELDSAYTEKENYFELWFSFQDPTPVKPDLIENVYESA